MTTRQLTVRIPDDLVDYADGLVADGTVKDRTAVFVEALRRMHAEDKRAREIAILMDMAKNPDPELEEFNEWANRPGARAWSDLD